MYNPEGMCIRSTLLQPVPHRDSFLMLANKVDVK